MQKWEKEACEKGESSTCVARAKMAAGREVGPMEHARPLRARVTMGVAVPARARSDRAVAAVRRRCERRAFPADPWEKDGKGFNVVGAAKTGAGIGV